MKTKFINPRWALLFLTLSLFGGLLVYGLSGTAITQAASNDQTIPPNTGTGESYLPLIRKQTTPTATPTTAAPERIQFAPGATSATVTGHVEFPVRKEYVLRALIGQQMTVAISSTGNLANFAVQGVTDGQPLKRVENEDRTWTGILPLTQDYLLTVAVPPGAADYVLHITIITPGSPTPTPTATSIWPNPASHIQVFSPRPTGLYHSPIEVIGFSQTFEGSVSLRLKQNDGTVLAERATQGGSSDGFAFFHSQLRFTASTQISATLEVFEVSAKDGSEINKVQIPVTLLPGQRVIDVDMPQVGANTCNPVVISGYSNTFEASLVVDLRQRNGAVITQTSTTGGNLGFYRDFTAALNHPISTPQPLLVSAYEAAASGAGLVDQTVIPVSVYPAGSSNCP